MLAEMNCFAGIGVVISRIASLDLHKTKLFVARANDNERASSEIIEKDVCARYVRPPDNLGQVIIQPGGRALHKKEQADWFAEGWSDGDDVSGVGGLLVAPYAIRRPVRLFRQS